MANTFHCPNCNAPLTYNSTGVTLECPYCGSSVVVPASLRPLQAALIDEMSGQAVGLAEVMIELQAGRKINAIRKYREMTGMGLAEAKAAVEELAATGQLSSRHFTPGPPSRVQVKLAGQPLKATPASSGSGGLFLGFFIFGIILLSIGVPLYFGLREVIFPPAPTPTVTPTSTPVPFGRLDQSFGQEGSGPGYFKDARTMALDSEGRVFVGDYSPGRIQAFAADGTFLWQHLTPGETDYVEGLATDLQGRLYAIVGRNIEVYEAGTGEPLARWEPEPHQVGWYEAIAVTPQGELVAVHPRELVKFSPEGEILLQVGGVEEDFLKLVGVDDFSARISGIAVDGEGTIYISIWETFILKLDPDGHLIDRLPGETDEDIYSLAVNGQGQIAWVYSYRVVLTDNQGQPLGDFKTGHLNDVEFNLQGQLAGISRNPPQVEIYTIGR